MLRQECQVSFLGREYNIKCIFICFCIHMPFIIWIIYSINNILYCVWVLFLHTVTYKVDYQLEQVDLFEMLNIFLVGNLISELKYGFSSKNHVMSRDGAASKRVTTCSSRLKLTCMNILFIRNTTPYISENRVFWLKYGF